MGNFDLGHVLSPSRRRRSSKQHQRAPRERTVTTRPTMDMALLSAPVPGQVGQITPAIELVPAKRLWPSLIWPDLCAAVLAIALAVAGR